MKKNIAIIFMAAAIILLIWHIATRPEPEFLSIGDNPDRKVEIENTELTGWKKGKKSWYIRADSIWFGQNRDIAFFDRIHRGNLYNNSGSLIMDELTGKDGRAYLGQESIFVSGNVYGRYINKKREKTILSAEQLTYSAGEMKLRGYVKAVQDEFEITAPFVTVQPTNNLTYFPMGFIWKSGKDRISAEYLEYNLDKYSGRISGNVEALLLNPTACITSRAGRISEHTYQMIKDVIYKSADTSFKCGQLEWFRKEGRLTARKISDLKKDGNVINGDEAEIWTEPFRASLKEKIVIQRLYDRILGKKAIFNNRNLKMTGGVVIEIERIGKHVPEKYRQKARAGRMQESLKQPAVIKGNVLAHYPKNEITIIRGKAEVAQGAKTARAEKIAYYTKEGVLQLEKDVQIKEGLEWINCDWITVNLDTSEFIVSGNVESRILIEK
ncbi:hypothetical protein ACFL57_00180 [Candidatus Margulisiibacteriota bacterium]